MAALDDTRLTHPAFLGVVAPSPIHVECDGFSGSLAALFQCARVGQVDLLGVPLFPVCEAYFRYLLDNSQGDIDSAAAALVALAYLLERKAWLLLPSATQEEEPALESATALEGGSVAEYAAAIEALRRWEEERGQMHFRSGGAGYELPFDLTDVALVDLSRAFERLLRQSAPDPDALVARHRRSLAQEMRAVREALCPEPRAIDQLMAGEFTRSDAVWWFLALLELIRLGEASVALEGEQVLFAAGGAA
jgi:segregation and condensation protein A